MHYQCEYQKSSRFSKTTSLHMQYTWCLCHHCKNMTWKFRLESSPFMEDVNNPGQNFLSFFWTWIWFLLIQLEESCLHFYFDKVFSLGAIAVLGSWGSYFECVLNGSCFFSFTCCRSKDSVGWELIFSTPYLKHCVEKMALNAKVTSSSLGDKMLAVSAGMFH